MATAKHDVGLAHNLEIWQQCLIYVTDQWVIFKEHRNPTATPAGDRHECKRRPKMPQLFRSINRSKTDIWQRKFSVAIEIREATSVRRHQATLYLRLLSRGQHQVTWPTILGQYYVEKDVVKMARVSFGKHIGPVGSTHVGPVGS